MNLTLHLLQSCRESTLSNSHVSAMTNHVCQLIAVVAKTLSKPEEETVDVASSEDASAQALIKKLADEWREFFSVSASGNLLHLWLDIAGT